MTNLIAPYKAYIDSSMSIVIGTVLEKMNVGIPESAVTNFFTDALLDYARKSENKNIDLAILNVAGSRKPLEEGDLTIGDIYELMPFENKIIIAEISGTTVQNLFDAFAQ